MYPHYRHDEFVDVTDEVWRRCIQAQREMENYERRKVYHRAYYSLGRIQLAGKLRTGTQQIAGKIFCWNEEEMTTRLYLIGLCRWLWLMPLRHNMPCSRSYYIAGIKRENLSDRGRPQQQG